MKKLWQHFCRMMYDIPVEKAQKRKLKLSVAYALVAWNTFGLVLYSVVKDKFPKNNDSLDYLKVLGVKDARIIKFSGTSKVADYDVNLSDEDIKLYHGIEISKDNSNDVSNDVSNDLSNDVSNDMRFK